MTESSNSGRGPAQGPRRGFVQNVLANWIGYVFNIVITFFLSPFVVHHLGDSLYGIWTLIVSLTGYLGLLDLGVRGAVTRYVAKFHAQQNHRDASRTASSALAIFAGVGVIAVGLAAAVVFTFLDRLQIPLEYTSAARIALLISGVTVALSLISGVFGGIIVALHRFDATNAVEVTAATFRAIAIVFVLTRHGGIISLGIIQAVSAAAIGSVYAWLSHRFYPDMRIRFQNVDGEHFRLIFSFSIYSFLLTLFAYVILYTDSIVIAIFLPVSYVTFFAIASNLITYSRGFISGITTTMTPLASRLEAQGSADELRQIVLMTSRTATALILPIALTFILRGKTFIELWMGTEYKELSGHVLWILSLYLVVSPASSVAWAVVMGLSKHKPLVPVFLFESMSNLGLSILLVKTMGVVGVAWGTTIPNLLVSIIFWPWYMHRTLKISRRRWYIDSWIRPILAMIPFAVCNYAIDRWWPARSLFFYFIQVGLATVVAFAGFWFTCLNPGERQSYLSKAKRSLRFG